MKQSDPLAALPHWGGLSRADRQRLSRVLEVVEVAAGAVAAPAGLRGRWVTVVLDGSVATTHPPAVHLAGDVVRHGPETALVAVTACRLATTTAALDSSLASLLLPGRRQAVASSEADEVTSCRALRISDAIRSRQRSASLVRRGIDRNPWGRPS